MHIKFRILTKRFFDFSFALLGIIVLFPFLFILWLLVALTSKGGGFYLQSRVGKDNRDFRLWKFRTMFTRSDQKGLLTIGGRDPRITPVGYFLRKYKLDELPQLINVLNGDMSLVGPRPEVRKYVNLYSAKQLEVLSIKPGITDYASIEYAHENELLSKANDPERFYIEEVMPAKLILNLKYIQEKSLWTDLRIIALTFRRILWK
jgi:lipopolysaccharide/colanic/teichoic acid biosynthesis glycosyltransferase